mgnify:CR=1 FL=1
MIKLIFSLVVLITHSSCAANNNSDFRVTTITSNVFSIVSPSKGLPTPENKGWNSNIHFVVTGKGVLLFDSGSSESIGHKIKEAIKSITDQPVRWIINSHSHADHWFGNAAFTNTAFEIITSNIALATMKEHGQPSLDFYSKVTKGTIGATQLVYRTVILLQGIKRNFGGIDVEFILSNDGHSPGDILIWLPKQKIIIGGDVLSSDWMPMITGHGNIPNLIKTLNTVEKLNPTIVLTGHGKATNVESVTRDAGLLSSVWKQVKSGYKKGVEPNETLKEVKAKLNPKYKLLYQDFDSEIERHVNLMYELQH